MASVAMLFGGSVVMLYGGSAAMLDGGSDFRAIYLVS